MINIGILGLGTVGTGVYKVLHNHPEVNIKSIAELDVDRERDINVKHLITTDYNNVVSDPDISIVVEVMGGVSPAFEAITAAIRNGKHVVTANKELLAKRGSEIFDLASEHNVVVMYEASVGGGIPIIMPLKQSLAANSIQAMAGILNGTTNYILTKMEQEKAEFADVLAEAQKLGYAEANPTSDIEGYDAAYKIAILASIAFSGRVDVTSVYREGISKVSTVDIDYALELGYRIKLIAMAKKSDDGRVDVRVHPTLVPKDHTLASINGVTNALAVWGDAVGEVNFAGPGAGQLPTASAIAGDVLAIVREMPHTNYVLPSMRTKYTQQAALKPVSDTTNSYYVRCHSLDRPGVIGHIGSVCGKHGVSLSSVLQKDMLDGGIARIILLTHEVTEAAMQSALDELRQHESTKEIANVIRVLK